MTRTGITITTVEELEALPTGSVVLDVDDDAALIDLEGEELVLQFTGTRSMSLTRGVHFGPFTVLHIPGEPTRPLPDRDTIAQAIVTGYEIEDMGINDHDLKAADAVLELLKGNTYDTK